MVSLETPVCDFDAPAVDFALPGIDGETWTLEQCRGKRPAGDVYLQPLPVREGDSRATGARYPRVARQARHQHRGDHGQRPDRIRRGFLREHAEGGRRVRLPLSLFTGREPGGRQGLWRGLHPDFFGYNADLKLQYRGRFDASRKETAPADARRDLFEAMVQVAETGRGPAEQIPAWAVPSSGKRATEPGTPPFYQ